MAFLINKDRSDWEEAPYPKAPSEEKSRLPKEVQAGLEIFFRKQVYDIEALRSVLLSLHLHCRRHAERADENAAQQALDLLSLSASASANVVVERFRKLLEKYLKEWQFSNALLLDPNWLKGWFFLKLLSSDCLARYRDKAKDRIFSPEETLLFFRHFSTLGLYVLHWMKNGGDAARFHFSDVEGGSREHLEALLYTLSEYAYIDYELTRRANLFHTLMEIWAHEAILYTIRDSYRDHMNHMVETCLLGLVLLDIEKEEEGDELFFPYGLPIIHTFFYKDLKKEKGDDLVFDAVLSSPKKRSHANWILAALMHDVGYALEIINNAYSQIEFMDTPIIREFKQKNLLHYGGEKTATIRAMKEALKESLPWVENLNISSLDHGLVSALYILWHVRDKGEPGTDWKTKFRQAIEASARHNLPGVGASYAESPMAWLLILCDHLQEWDRPLITGKEVRHSLAVSFMGKEWRGLESKSIVKYIAMEGVELKEHGKPVLKKNNKGLSFTLHFAEFGHGEYHPALTWAQGVYDLQHLKRFEAPLVLNLRHPLLEGQTLEMDALQAFLRDQPEMADLRQWAVSSREHGKKCSGWHGYHFTNGGSDGYAKGFEEYRIDLRQNKNLAIPQIPKDFVAEFIKWKKARKII